MTTAAAPVMHGPDGMRLFLAAAPAAIIAALLAAASTNGNTSPVAKAFRPLGQANQQRLTMSSPPSLAGPASRPGEARRTTG
jgi:hypothetical protein